MNGFYGDAGGYHHQFYTQYQYPHRPHLPLAGVMAMLPEAGGGGGTGDDDMCGEERICHEEGHERASGEQEESLDDSMHWFSSTCLGTAFSNPDQQVQ